MKVLGVVCVFCLVIFAVAAKLELPPEWHNWKATHGKSYESDHEELGRHIVWLSNNKYIDEHNKYAETFGYTLKMNKFGDLVCNSFEYINLIFNISDKC